MGWLATSLLACSLALAGPADPEAARLEAELQTHFDNDELSAAIAAGEALLAHQQAQLGPDSPHLAAVFGELGVLHEVAGDLQSAAARYTEALAHLERLYGTSHPALVGPLNDLGSLRQSAGELDEARAHYQRAEALCERGEVAAALHADTLNNHATLLYELGAYQAAQERYERSLALLEELGPDYVLDQADLRTNLASLHHDLGQTETALVLAERALAVYEAELGPRSPDVATALNNLAAMDWDLGELRRARRRYEAALDIYTEHLGAEHPDVANVLSNLGVLVAELGDPEQAQRLLTRSLAIYEATLGPEHIAVADVRYNLAGVLADQGAHAEALQRYQQVLAIFTETFGPDSLPVADALNNMAATHQDLGQLAEARLLLERSLSIHARVVGAENPVSAEVRHNLAQVAAGLGEPEVAAEHLRRSIAVTRAAYGDGYWLLAESLVELGALEWTLGRPALAEAHLAEALALATGRLDLLASLSDREGALYLQSLRSPLDLWLNLHNAPADAEQAFSHVLAWKGAGTRAVQERLELARADPDTRSALGRLREARRKLAEAALATPDPGALEAHRAELDALTDARDAAERALADGSTGQALQVRLAPTPQAVCAALPSDATWVDVLRVPSRDGAFYAVLVVTADCRITRVDLPDADGLDARIASWRAALAEDLSIAAERGRRVTEAIWTPLSPHLGTGRLWVSPDAELAQLPWAALPLDGGLLVEEREVQVLPSASVLLAAEAPRGRGLLTVGGVAYGQGSQDVGPCIEGPFAPLPATVEESRALARQWRPRRRHGPLTRLTGHNATEAALVTAAPGNRVLHIASHGWLADTTCAERRGLPPLVRSAVVLAGANTGDPPGRGLLTAEELAAVDLRGCQLVLLSACNTGRGEVRTGEGLLGLQRGLALAGAEAAVVSLWPVPDAETAALMVGVLRGVLAGERPAAALRAAQLHALAQQRERYGSDRPGTWAAWIVSGR